MTNYFYEHTNKFIVCYAETNTFLFFYHHEKGKISLSKISYQIQVYKCEELVLFANLISCLLYNVKCWQYITIFLQHLSYDVFSVKGCHA